MKGSSAPLDPIEQLLFKSSHKLNGVVVSENFETPNVITMDVCSKGSKGCCVIGNITGIKHDTVKTVAGSNLKAS